MPQLTEKQESLRQMMMRRTGIQPRLTANEEGQGLTMNASDKKLASPNFDESLRGKSAEQERKDLLLKKKFGRNKMQLANYSDEELAAELASRKKAKADNTGCKCQDGQAVANVVSNQAFNDVVQMSQTMNFGGQHQQQSPTANIQKGEPETTVIVNSQGEMEVVEVSSLLRNYYQPVDTHPSAAVDVESMTANVLSF
ncbi:hypothetical protein AB1L42_21840 [Thalassoglobus sp. JC818]|uniref:hypothetical protein n=1 Tax=Thalassoglobus sp. JC818 TaxID=3232136 RepID=UPI003459FF9D